MEMTDREKIENIKKKLKELTTKEDGNIGFEFTRGGGKRKRKSGGSKGGREARQNNKYEIPQNTAVRAQGVTEEELDDLERALIFTIFDLPEGPLQDSETGGFVLNMILGERQHVIGRLTTVQGQSIINKIEAEFGLRRSDVSEERIEEIKNTLRPHLVGVQGGKRRKKSKRRSVKAKRRSMKKKQRKTKRRGRK
tara:strand:- start:2775 stop:3359 length:585 start_codon:yes stop_codon:yes gene_type:complete